MKKTRTVVAVAFTLSCLFLCLNMFVPVLADEGNLTITAIKPYHYEWSEEYDIAKGDPWFNLTNYVEVTVVNNGTTDDFKVELYADDERIGSETESLPAGEATDVKFEWMPKGEDPLGWTDTAEGAELSYTDTNKEYTLRAVVEGDSEVLAEYETKQKVVWNGYTADEPLENYVHGEVEGGIIYTTGDGQYRSGESGDSGTKYDTYYKINYDLEIPGSTKLARLYIYYTWAHDGKEPKAPKIGVALRTPADNYDLSMEKSYNDIKGWGSYAMYAWGTYAYNITEYVKESGEYIVTVTNLNGGGAEDFAKKYSFSAPAIIIVYEDSTAPEREYWINEGADVLMGGRDERPEGGFLGLEECMNIAPFLGDIDLSEVEKAALGVVSPWGEDEENVVYFNDKKLGEGVYCGGAIGAPACSKEMEGMSMNIGANDAQVGIYARDVTNYLWESDNEVIQGANWDNMMPVNAFLVITYEKNEEEEEGGEGTLGSPNITAWQPVGSVVNNAEGESRTFNITVNQTVDISWQINGTEVQTNKSVTKAAYTNTSAVVGTWNVSAIATNTTDDFVLSDIHTWIWDVTLTPATTPTPAVNITTTPTPTATPISTSTPTLAITPTSTPTPAEEKKQPGEEETPVPGFELTMSSFILIAVAYWIRNQRKI